MHSGDRDLRACLLMQRLGATARFRVVPRLCTRETPGIDDVPEWQTWTRRETNIDQLRIEEALEEMARRSASILHVGAGNSNLGRRFAPLVRHILAVTIHEEEAVLSDSLGLDNYRTIVVNKYSSGMDEISGQFNFIVDNNPSSYACCLFHFSRMLVTYHDLLKDGGKILTAQPGLSWVHSGNDQGWSLEWDDWMELGRALRMPTVQITNFVYAMERDSSSGFVGSEMGDNPGRREDSDQTESVQDLADLPARTSLTEIDALQIPILAYHSIADDGPPELQPWRITPSAFDEQLRFLKHHGFRSISLDEWTRCITAQSRPPGKPVIITFDDGYADFLANAAPRLEAAGFNATIFVVTGRVGATANWDTTSGPPLKLMTWDDLRLLETRGFSVGSHTTAHLDLTALTDEEIESDSREARATLRRELGHDVDTVAFPGGTSDARVRAALTRAGYRVGVEIADRCSTFSDSVGCLPRIEPLATDDIDDFARKLGQPGIPSRAADIMMPRDASHSPAGKLFTSVYNDARLLGHFLKHYSREGITEFFIATHPDFGAAIGHFRSAYNITVVETAEVADHFIGGATAVTEMRRRFQDADEWAVIVDLDEFVEFGGELAAVIQQAEREGANVVRAIMWDRFARDGKIVGFEPDSDLRQVFPIRARFINNVMRGADYKGVLVKGRLGNNAAHHTFLGEVVCSRQLDLSHYKWFDGAIERVKAAHRMLTEADKPWAIEYQRALEHYAQNGRLAWEQFGGEPDPLSMRAETAQMPRPTLARKDVGEFVEASEAIPGWTSGDDAQEIALASFALGDNPVIVEIGVFLGRCTVLLAGPRRRLGSGLVHGIDPFDGSGDAFSLPHYRRILESLGNGSQRDHFEANIADAGLGDWVKVHQGRGEDIAASWEQPIDLLLLDGDQSPEGARAAYEAWVKFLKPGGILVLRNTPARDYAEGHDGHRRLAMTEVVPGKYDEIRHLTDTTIARKVVPQVAAAAGMLAKQTRQLRSRVHVYAQCWNDEFMLPYFFRHYDPFVDRYVIFDDGSTDRSREILERHPKVEMRRFVRSDPEWFVKSEQALSNACWKESRGSADWVIVTDVDEHLYHPAMQEYLRACADSTITLIPALGFQMLSESLPGKTDLLCDTLTFGAPYYDLMKVSLFRPDAIEEINFTFGRDQVDPIGDIRVPQRDELLLLHYKYLGLEQTYARHQALLARLGERDFDAEGRWKHPYSWSIDELRGRWQYLADRAVNVRTAFGENYPIPRWWLPTMETVDVTSNWVSSPMIHEPPPEPRSQFGNLERVIHVADAARYSPLEIEAEPQYFQFRGYDLFLHPPIIGATRLRARDIAPGAASAVFTCALSLDDRSAGPVVFRMRFFDASQTVWREAVLQPGERREIKLSLDGFDGPLSAEFMTEMQAATPSNHFAWATFHEPRLT